MIYVWYMYDIWYYNYTIIIYYTILYMLCFWMPSFPTFWGADSIGWWPGSREGRWSQGAGLENHSWHVTSSETETVKLHSPLTSEISPISWWIHLDPCCNIISVDVDLRSTTINAEIPDILQNLFLASDHGIEATQLHLVAMQMVKLRRDKDQRIHKDSWAATGTFFWPAGPKVASRFDLYCGRSRMLVASDFGSDKLISWWPLCSVSMSWLHYASFLRKNLRRGRQTVREFKAVILSFFAVMDKLLLSEQTSTVSAWCLS